MILEKRGMDQDESDEEDHQDEASLLSIRKPSSLGTSLRGTF